MKLEDYSILIFIFTILGVFFLIFIVKIGLAIISLDRSLKKYVDLEYKKYLEGGNYNEKDSVSH